MMRDESGGTRPGELRALIREVRLVEIAKIRRNSLGVAGRCGFHALQRRLKPHDPCQALWSKADPIAHEPMQLPRADLTVARELRHSEQSGGVFNCLDRSVNAGVDVCPDQSLPEKCFQDIKPLFDCLCVRQEAFETSSCVKQQRRQGRAALGESVNGDASQQESDAREEPHAEERLAERR